VKKESDMGRIEYIKVICDNLVDELGIQGLRVGVNSKRRFRSYEIFIHYKGRVGKYMLPWNEAEWVKKNVLIQEIHAQIGEVINGKQDVLE
jgi:hypothetical protein